MAKVSSISNPSRRNSPAPGKSANNLPSKASTTQEAPTSKPAINNENPPMFSSILHSIAAPGIAISLIFQLVGAMNRKTMDDKLDSGQILTASELNKTDKSSMPSQIMAAFSLLRGLFDASPVIMAAYGSFVWLSQKDIDTTKLFNHLRQEYNILSKQIEDNKDNLTPEELEDLEDRLQQIKSAQTDVSGQNIFYRCAVMALTMSSTYWVFTRMTDKKDLTHQRPHGQNAKQFMKNWWEKLKINSVREPKAAWFYLKEATGTDKPDKHGRKAYQRWWRDITGKNPEFEARLKTQGKNKMHRGLLRFGHKFNMRTLTMVQSLLRLGGALTLLYAAKTAGYGILNHGSRYEDEEYEKDVATQNQQQYNNVVGSLNVATKYLYPAGTAIAALTAIAANNPEYLKQNGYASLLLRNFAGFVGYPFIAMSDATGHPELSSIGRSATSGSLQTAWAVTVIEKKAKQFLKKK